MVQKKVYSERVKFRPALKNSLMLQKVGFFDGQDPAMAIFLFKIKLSFL